ncbi:MAG: asparagine synthase C-terminal domain-containing protein [Brevundimonas sp.]|uniref:asparagine synthase-related protein n=1 Tax=Brevundimonas sp. TaxID=1871086 RepID=UPI002565C27A|nr:asparagine synthase C-terminal domain-containing protein [Brevundimonas sp.]MDK2745726.1 asparagine synthase C-terminal domain-containing protein [Brevundimonas sp.]
MAADAVVILVGDTPAALEAMVAPVRRRLSRAGWSRKTHDPFIAVFAPTQGRLEITRGLDGHGVLVGEVFDGDGHALSPTARAVLGLRRLDTAGARAVCSERWGRYLLVRRIDGNVAVLRDPSGALECVVWRKRGVTLISTSAAAVIDPWLPDHIAIDWDQLADGISRPGDYRHRLPLLGLEPVAGGALRTHGAGVNRVEQIWKPAEIYRRRRDRPPPDLRAVVERSVRALAGDRRWVVEVSGGLDSAIVTAALTADQRGQAVAWVNHYVDHPEGDERAYARAVADRHGLALTEVRRDGLRLDAARLTQSAEGFRPATNDIDPDYNDDIADRIEAPGAWGSLTGQGGDAVFFQMPSLLIGLDELRERGLRARPRVLHRVSRWLRRSLWPTALAQAWREDRHGRADWAHPWTDDLAGVPPAKALQIAVLSFCQSFQGPSVRSRLGPCVNPLLSQPVMEAGLALSTVDLTWGGRDRAMVRAAFADALPPSILERRSKGELGAYYGGAVAGRLGFLRDYLLGGALAEAGLIDHRLEDRLDRDILLWRGGHSDILSLALTEAWLRRWRARLAQRPV